MDNQAKLAEAKRKCDMMIGLPGVALRKGVARHGDPLTGFVDYNYKLFRDDGRRWTLYVEWVDPDGEGYRIVLPHEVVEAVLKKADAIIAQARKDRAQRAADTRKRKAVEAAGFIVSDTP